MEESLNPELVNNLLSFEGNIRGMDIKSDGLFVLENYGKEILEKVQQYAQANECSLEYLKINPWAFVPGGLKAISLLAIRDVLNFNEEKIVAIGSAAPQRSFIIRLSLKFFADISRFIFQESSRVWRKYWTVGNFVPLECNEKEKRVRVRIENFKLHPIYCHYLRGFLSALPHIALSGKNPKTIETKCVFRGDPYHEFVVGWE